MNDTHVIENLPILILYPHNRCNCRCVMCDIWKLETVEEIDISDLQRHASDIETLGVRWVVFSGGEPLMHSDLFRLGDFLRERGIRTTILSTGLLLARNASSVVRSVDDVIVSLDGPPQAHDRIRRVRGAFELLSAGVRAVHALNPDFPVAARTTVQHANFSLLRETVKAAMELGLRSISFLAADLTSTAFNRPAGWPEARQAQVALTEMETNRLESEIEELIGELPQYQGFVLERPEKLRRIVRHFRAHLGLTEQMAPNCNAPWVSAVVESDGTVRPCFFHRAIGNVKQRSLREVLNDPQALEFRRTLDVSLDPVCRRCVCSLYLAGRVWKTEVRSQATG
jgi:radical SAM protein with 4Fe4S-binding SPASM domain